MTVSSVNANILAVRILFSALFGTVSYIAFKDGFVLINENLAAFATWLFVTLILFAYRNMLFSIRLAQDGTLSFATFCWTYAILPHEKVVIDYERVVSEDSILDYVKFDVCGKEFRLENGSELVELLAKIPNRINQ